MKAHCYFVDTYCTSMHKVRIQISQQNFHQQMRNVGRLVVHLVYCITITDQNHHPHRRTSQAGGLRSDRAFPVAAARLCNSLLLLSLSPFFADVLNHISSHFLIPLSDSCLISTVPMQWLIILDTLNVITSNIFRWPVFLGAVKILFSVNKVIDVSRSHPPPKKKKLAIRLWSSVISMCDVCSNVNWCCLWITLISCQRLSSDLAHQNYSQHSFCYFWP